METILRTDLYTKKAAYLATILSFVTITLVVGLNTLYAIFNSDILSFLWLLLMILVMFPISIAIHELGHLVFGLISGYKFIHYQFLFFRFEKIKGKLHFSFILSPLLGQCLMGVSEEKKDDIKFTSYLLGGSIFNLITMIISLTVMTLVYVFTGTFIYLLLPVFGINFYMFISNGIPLNVNGIYNDALNVRLMKKYKIARDALINTLVLEYYHANDYSIMDISDDILTNNHTDLPNYYIHSYVFSFYETIKKVVSKEASPFNRLVEWEKVVYNLPQVYANQNYELLALKRMVDNEEYEYIFKLKINEKMFKSEQSDISKVDNILYKYKKSDITSFKALDLINSLEELTPKNGYHTMDIEFYSKLRDLARDYINGLYPIVEEIKDETDQSETNRESIDSVL